MRKRLNKLNFNFFLVTVMFQYTHVAIQHHNHPNHNVEKEQEILW